MLYYYNNYYRNRTAEETITILAYGNYNTLNVMKKKQNNNNRICFAAPRAFR